MTTYNILGIAILLGIIFAIKELIPSNNKKNAWRKPYRRSKLNTEQQINNNEYDDNFINEQLSLKKWPFKKRKIMTKTECQLYQLIKETVPHLHIFAQVQLSQIIFFPERNKYKEKNYWTNRINRMSLDYVITNENFETIAVIELDDPSHERPERKERDLKKDKALADAGIKIIRIPINEIPPKALLRQKIINSYKE